MPTTSKSLSALLRTALPAIAALGLSAAVVVAEEKSPTTAKAFTETGPVTASRERQFEFTSGINGLPYRLMVSAPKMEPGKRYPVLFVFDGNWYFRIASDTATWGSGTFEPAIVVGIGYPTEERSEINRRRAIDLTIVEEKSRFANGSGGCDAFLRVIEEEIKPFIAGRYAVDPARYMLYGKSIGGLAVLRALFTLPERYSTYLIVSPSIWQGDKAVLAGEAAFSEKARTGALNLRILFSVGGDEDYKGTEPAIKADFEANGTVSNSRSLANRLGKLAPDKVLVRFATFPDENHNTVSNASIARAITFALPPPPPRAKGSKK